MRPSDAAELVALLLALGAAVAVGARFSEAIRSRVVRLMRR